MATREEAAAAHLIERLAGREGADRPRQIVCRWLTQHGHEDRLADFNELYRWHSSRTSCGFPAEAALDALSIPGEDKRLAHREINLAFAAQLPGRSSLAEARLRGLASAAPYAAKLRRYAAELQRCAAEFQRCAAGLQSRAGTGQPDPVPPAPAAVRPADQPPLQGGLGAQGHLPAPGEVQPGCGGAAQPPADDPDAPTAREI